MTHDRRLKKVPRLPWKPLAVFLSLAAGVVWGANETVLDPAGLDFFEKEIRPLLAEHCYECHSARSKKLKGGLRLDTRDGWRRGGDSGPAIVPGQPEASRLLEAVRYGNSDLEMPPKQKLSNQDIDRLTRWIALGAPDPRVANEDDAAKPIPRRGLSLEEGRKFWAYQTPQAVPPPAVRDEAWSLTEVDQFLLAQMETTSLRPAPDAEPIELVRRLYFDLIGLPPTPDQIDDFAREPSREAWVRGVDRLLASPQFGERWGRHWLDVARFGESVTLRGFIFPEAWRYRDYVIDAFNRDLPFDRFVMEQVAGDLLPAVSLSEQQRLRVAPTFLVLGNINFEDQDKKQLDMDVVDEQLDTLGKAFLAQTIGCARCHDHKFDPIPTSDYYALAGILRSVQTLEHANVSKWLEVPLPVDEAEKVRLQSHERAIAALEEEIKSAKESVARLKEPLKNATAESPAILPADAFAGVLVDDDQAKAVGDWKPSKYTQRYIGQGYRHDLNEGKGAKTLTFVPELTQADRYEVRFAYSAHDSRATNVPVTIFSAEGEFIVQIDERRPPNIEGRFVSLGIYRFEPNGQGFVMVGTEGTKGYVTADAMQFLPANQNEPAKVLAAVPTPEAARLAEDRAEERRQAHDRLKALEARLKAVKADGPRRPMVMAVKEGRASDIPIHIRGSVHNLGEMVPRGFLSVVAATTSASPIPSDQSGRLELAEWLGSRENPLTARVMVNRVWHWLFGAGLVRTTDNFGTTGERPSHPELLDTLAVRFMDHGWSVKWLVRELVLSRAYQLSSRPGPRESTDRETDLDAENRLLSHMNRRRLDAEGLRDGVLFVSGRLNLEMGGSTVAPGASADYGQVYDEPRRSVYVPVYRNALPEMFEVFDFADPSVVTGRRNQSTVAMQALFFLNHPWVMDNARWAARQLLNRDLPGDEQRIVAAYRQVLGRPPTATELAAARSFLQTSNADPSAVEALWAQVYQALFASIDFRYLK